MSIIAILMGQRKVTKSLHPLPETFSKEHSMQALPSSTAHLALIRQDRSDVLSIYNYLLASRQSKVR